VALPSGLRAPRADHARYARLTDIDNPGQESIEEAVAFPQSSNRRDKLLKHISEVGRSFPETLDRYNINIIIGPADSWFTKYSAATGEKNEKPFP
jgi:hypothetical protein